MNICGVLVHAVPEHVSEVKDALAVVPGAELHGEADNGRLIVTLEDTSGCTAVDGLAAIHRLPGVVAAALVYHYCEHEEFREQPSAESMGA